MFLTIILSKLKPLLTNFKFWLVMGLIILTIISVKQCRSLQKSGKENDRLENNIKNINQDLNVQKTKSGKLMYSVNSLTLKKDEIELYNKKLKGELSDMKIKLKNVQTVLNLNLGYSRIVDTIKSEKIITEYINNQLVLNTKNIERYNFKLDDKESYISGNINIPYKIDSTSVNKYKILDESKNPFLSAVDFKFNDSLLVVSEIQYKKVWLFFKKPIGVKTHIKSENKYFNLNKVYNYNIVK